MSQAPKSQPQTEMDVSTSVAVNIAKLLVFENWTVPDYRKQREYVNSIPGVDIQHLPRDSEFGYSADQAL